MEFVISRVNIQDKINFLDYILGGCELQVSFAVGFAHKQEGHLSNTKDKADVIKQVGNFLMNYDTDGLVDIYGFNGIIPGTTHTSRFFAINGKMFDPDV